MFFTAVANLLLGSPSVAVDAESVCSELSVVSSKIDDSPYDILDEEEIEAVQIVNGSCEGIVRILFYLFVRNVTS